MRPKSPVDNCDILYVHMIYIALGVVIACQVVMICLLSLAFQRVSKVFNETKADILTIYNEGKSNFLSFITPPGEGKLSRAAEVTQLVADEFSRAMVAKAKAVFMNQASIASRQGKIIEGEIAQEAISGTSVGSLLSQLPMVQKSLKKNPLLGLALARLLGGGSNTMPTAEQPNNDHKAKFNL